MTEQTAMQLDTKAGTPNYSTALVRVALGNIQIISDEISGLVNPRGAAGDTTGLQTSIEASGLIQPIGLVPQLDAPHKYWLLWGHRRFTAYKALRDQYRHLAADLREQNADEARIIEADEKAERFSAIDAVVRADVDVNDRVAVRTVMLAENSGREDIPMLHLARAIRDLKTRGVKTAQAAAILGVTLDRARVIEDLVDEPEEVRTAVEAGKIDVEGFRAMRAMDAEAKEEIAKKANELPEGQKMKRAAVRAEVEKSKAGKPAAPKQAANLFGGLAEEPQEDAVDAAELIASAQNAVSAMLAVLDTRLYWPADAKPAVQFQITRLVARLKAEGFATESGTMDRPGFRAVDMGSDEAEEIDEGDDAPLTAQELAAIELVQKGARDALSKAAADERAARPAGVQDVEVEYKPDAAQMKFTIKVPGMKPDRKRDAKAVLKALDKLAAEGHTASAETIADLKAIVNGDVEPAEIEATEE